MGKKAVKVVFWAWDDLDINKLITELSAWDLCKMDRHQHSSMVQRGSWDLNSSQSYWKLVAHEGRCINPFSGIATSELLIVQWLALQPCSCWQSWLNIMNDKAESKTKTKRQDSRRWICLEEGIWESKRWVWPECIIYTCEAVKE